MRYLERKEEFKKALLKLKDGVTINESEIQRDGVIQRFEFTFELAWKTVKDYLEFQGFTEKIGSPREIIQLGFKQGIIEDGEAWIEMMLSRNALSHLYDEKTAIEIYNKIREKYIKLFEKLELKFQNA